MLFTGQSLGTNKSPQERQNKDDKLTQSQLLKRMLEAEERDNQRDRQRETEFEQRDRNDQARLNEAQMFVRSTESRGGRQISGLDESPIKMIGSMEGEAEEEKFSEVDYVSSSMPSSYRTLSETERQRILNEAASGANGHGVGLNLQAVKQNKNDFQDDFMAKYDEFSESWRKACDEMRRL